MERRLTTILAADVVGYSRLMGQDETATLAAVKADRRDIFGPKEAQYRGRTVKLMGDGTLMEFASVVDAVRFAVEVQAAVAERNATAPEKRCIAYRIGINIGDIMVDGDDIYGDGVNVAARLEALSDPGGIMVSRNVFDQVKGKLNLTFEDLGEKRMKNIAEPVPVYRIVFDDKVTALVTHFVQEPTTMLAPTRSNRWPIIAAGCASGFVAIVGLAVWLSGTSDVEPAVVAQMAFPLPDKPSIAVLPFDNMSEDESQDFFVDGMTEDLITDLSNISGLFVIARNSSFSYKDRQVKVREVAEELGVRYVLQGSVRRAGGQVRINTQLIDAVTGGHVWAQRYDRKLDDIFAVQDAITVRVVQALQLRLTEADESPEIRRPATLSIEAYDMVLHARKLLTRFDRQAATEARSLLERAIKLDSAYVEAYSLLGWYYFDEWRLWGKRRNENLSRALGLANTAVSLDSSNPGPHVLLAQIYQFRREFEVAGSEADMALALNPSDAVTLGNLGSMLRYAHRAEEAAEVMERAIRLDPFHPPNYLEWLGDAYLLLGRYDDCIRAVERGVALDSSFVALHVIAAECYAALGNKQKARDAAAKVLRANPRFTLKAFASYVPFTSKSDLELKVRLLRMAGIPD